MVSASCSVIAKPTYDPKTTVNVVVSVSIVCPIFNDGGGGLLDMYSQMYAQKSCSSCMAIETHDHGVTKLESNEELELVWGGVSQGKMGHQGMAHEEGKGRWVCFESMF